MNTRTIVASLLSGLVLVWTSLALGGVEPSPFHQLINELDSVENVLDAVDDQLKEILYPPDPIGKLVGQLDAMTVKLVRQNDRVEDVIEASPDVPPDPVGEEFMAALGKVGSKASSIAERAGMPPDPCAPEVEEALEAVETAALGIVETVYGSMPSIS